MVRSERSHSASDQILNAEQITLLQDDNSFKTHNILVLVGTDAKTVRCSTIRIRVCKYLYMRMKAYEYTPGHNVLAEEVVDVCGPLERCLTQRVSVQHKQLERTQQRQEDLRVGGLLQLVKKSEQQLQIRWPVETQRSGLQVKQ